MAAVKILEKRFGELHSQMEAVGASKFNKRSEYSSGDYVNSEALLNWQVKCKNLIQKACGEDSQHYKAFVKSELPVSFRTNYLEFIEQKAIFEAAKEDYEGGYVSTVRSLVQAQVFSSETDQARELLISGYLSASAVIAGVVLETTLRQMCDDRGVAQGKLDRMNADLAKAGAYSILVQKRITAIADIRNNAAHGKTSLFNSDDVEEMIIYVERFVERNI